MKRKVEERYDHRTMNIIRDRVAGLDDHAIVVRECNRTTVREKLVSEWVTTAGSERLVLRAHLAERIKLADFELDLIRNAMDRRGIPQWSEQFMKEADNKGKR